MSNTDSSGKIGEYILKGWVFTGETCPNTNCRVALIRSPTGQTPVTMVCTNCDDDSQIGQPSPPHETVVNASDVGSQRTRNSSLDTAASSLELALQSLSARLSSSVTIANHSSGVEPSAIRDTVEGVIKILQALQTLEEVRKLHAR